ncbi:hypothetical protein [uncultured Treponema sp.]|uniref:hypothetical protein n=1 Tax=uncultured Treponema sp. TaxID=162155 RepID=UPI0025FD8F15|nr:hypothetical protein [uncultured Treponema sp.]
MEHFEKILLVFIFILILSVFSFSFSNYRKTETINQNLEKMSSSFSDEIKNQTSIFYRVIGEQIPVVIPEDKKAQLQALINKLPTISLKIAVDQYEEAYKLYSSYLKSTAPWIQEEQSNELFEIKLILDFCAIISSYSTNQVSLNYTIQEIDSLIYTYNDFPKINEVEQIRDELVQLRNKPLQDVNEQLKKRIVTQTEIKAHKKSEVQTLISDIDKQLLKLNDSMLYDDIAFFENSMVQLNQIFENATNNELYEQYTADYKNFVDKIKKNVYDENLYVSLQGKIPLVQKIQPGLHDEDDLILYEWKTFYELKTTCINTKNSFDSLKQDISKFNQVDFNLLLNEIYGLSNRISIIAHTKEIDTKDLVSQVQTLSKCADEVEQLHTEFENRQFAKGFDLRYDDLKKKTLAGNFSLAIYNQLQKEIVSIQAIYPDEYKSKSIELEELKLYSDILESINACKNQVTSMSNGENKLNEIKTSSVNEQMSYISYNLTLFKYLDIKNLNNQLVELTSSLKNKIASLEKSNVTDEQKLIKTYNSQVIALLQKTNYENNRLNSKETFKGYKSADKRKAIIDGRVDLLITLEKVESSYLYPSVYTLYNQIYASIWSTNEGDTALDTEDQFKVVNKALTTQKWGLYDTF